MIHVCLCEREVCVSVCVCCCLFNWLTIYFHVVAPRIDESKAEHGLEEVRIRQSKDSLDIVGNHQLKVRLLCNAFVSAH